MKYPFKEEIISENIKLRLFESTVLQSELIWHRDKNDRLVEVVSGTGWKIQFDNELPTELEKGKYYVIPEMDYHRVIKGEGSLILEIEEKEE